jgi:hypothetical protein
MITQTNNRGNNEINRNCSIPVIVKTNLNDWHEKSSMGIIRKRLEVINVDAPWLSTLVQYPAGVTFKKCTHNRGEEFLVLSGDFSNNRKTYSAGTYVRNPPGVQQASSTEHGCTLLFKTGQFQTLDKKAVAINANLQAASWQSAGEPGVSRMELHQFLDESVNLYKIRPQCWVTFKQCTHSIEVLVCEGCVIVDGIKYETGTWFRYPPNSRLVISSLSNACLFVKKRKYTR